MKFHLCSWLIGICVLGCTPAAEWRNTSDFSPSWQFTLGDLPPDQALQVTDSSWRTLHLPHDWSIESDFSDTFPATAGGGALPGGVGWYRKSFDTEADWAGKHVFIQFDGVYQNSEVWLNGQLLGRRPNGYISFEYNLTPHLREGGQSNVLAVRVDNSQQPNSRWYSGSGIYRNVRLVVTDPIFFPIWGTYVTTTRLDESHWQVDIETTIQNASDADQTVTLVSRIKDIDKPLVSETTSVQVAAGGRATVQQSTIVENPGLWHLNNPKLYNLTSELQVGKRQTDVFTTRFGFREFRWDAAEGFSLNGEPMKIQGVCNHHDLGCLGAAVNRRAIQRQLEIMKAMGVNAIRTAHNPPAPELLDLCDEMGLLVMNEMFDMWALKKSPHDYAQHFAEWAERDLKDFVLRDRNHPSIVAWSIGNEIIEQYNHADSTGGKIAQRLAAIVRELDSTRPILTANNDASPDNPLIKLGGLDIVGYNYNHGLYEQVPQHHPGRPFVATETNSALMSRGHYDFPSDSVRIWPHSWDKAFLDGNPDHSVSAYDHVRTPWGSTHEDTWRIVKKNPFLSGIFIWTGFDYLGEPTPYSWPSRSSYFGLVDLAGFPKDAYYMYQSEWTNDTVLHVFPHWNWTEGQLVDVWAYYNQADEVELFLNGASLGVKTKPADTFHVMWRVPFVAGELKAVSRKGGVEVLTRTIRTAGAPHRIVLDADRSVLQSGVRDLSFITARVVDKNGVMVPNASHLIRFATQGNGTVVGTDNGHQTDHRSLTAPERNAFHGMALAVVQVDNRGEVIVQAQADGLEPAEAVLKVE